MKMFITSEWSFADIEYAVAERHERQLRAT